MGADLHSNKDHYALDTTHSHDIGKTHSSSDEHANAQANAEYGTASAEHAHGATTHDEHGHKTHPGHVHHAVHHHGHPVHHGIHGHHAHGHHAVHHPASHAEYAIHDTGKTSSDAHANSYGSEGSKWETAAHAEDGSDWEKVANTHSEVQDHEDLTKADKWADQSAQNYGDQSASHYASAAHDNAQAGKDMPQVHQHLLNLEAHMIFR